MNKIFTATVHDETPNSQITSKPVLQDLDLAKDALFVARSPLKLYDEFLKYLRDEQISSKMSFRSFIS